MRQPFSRRTLRGVFAVVIVVSAIGALSGCGSQSTKSGSAKASTTVGSAAAGSAVPAALKAVAAAATGRQPWRGPTTSPHAVTNKFVVAIPCALAAVGCAVVNDGVVAAAKVLGWKVQVLDPEGSAQKAIADIQEAVSEHANAVALNSQYPPSLASAIAAARAAGLAVVDVNGYGGVKWTVTPKTVQADVTFLGQDQGRALAAQVCAASAGSARILEFPDNENEGNEQRWTAWNSTFKQCPGAKVLGQYPWSLAALDTTLTSTVESAIEANPTANVVMIPGDYAALAIVTGVEEAGAKSKIKAYSDDGDAQQVAWLRSGRVMAADEAEAVPWEGWAEMDELNRIFNNQQPVAENIPSRLLTAANAPAVGGYAGDVDYQARFQKLWGVK